MKLQFHGVSWDHYQHWVETDKATLRNVNRLLLECQRHPFEGKGKPEPLKG